jgi:hypothetical protein
MSSSRPSSVSPPRTPRGTGAGAPPPRRHFLARRNLVILAAALLVLVVGYVTLAAGHASVAAAILVIGYCVLFPLGIAL